MGAAPGVIAQVAADLRADDAGDGAGKGSAICGEEEDAKRRGCNVHYGKREETTERKKRQVLLWQQKERREQAKEKKNKLKIKKSALISMMERRKLEIEKSMKSRKSSLINIQMQLIRWQQREKKAF